MLLLDEENVETYIGEVAQGLTSSVEYSGLSVIQFNGKRDISGSPREARRIANINIHGG